VSAVTVTWMDGTQETYRADSLKTDEAQLHIFTRNQTRLGARESYHLPLANIRVWKEER
jgi:hypothetical protein